MWSIKKKNSAISCPCPTYFAGRQKSGFWGFRSDKVETIHGYESKVFSATGLDIVSRTRVEHLPETEKSKHKAVK